MSTFLLLLVKLNLVMGATIILVSFLRRPLRVLFGAPIAYAIWFLVPIASIASLFPPRVAAPVLAHVAAVSVPAAPVFVIGPIAHSVMRVTEQLTGQGVLMSSTIAVPLPASGMPDYALLLFVAWALGTLLMASYLTRLQLRFRAAVRRGEAGPAVLGFFSPRIVTPNDFQERFTSQEQAAILSHERVHVARQDARINALAAFLRCLCWFNPLVHLGAHWLRIDQELACDATAVAGAISRRDYAKALLKSQIAVAALPLGCNWPGSQHPLIERVALLKRKTPATARRLAGVGLVVLVGTSVGLGAWAAQPPVAAKFAVAAQRNNRVAITSPSAMRPAPSHNPGALGAGQLVADANPIAGRHHVDDVKEVPADQPVFAASPLTEVAPQSVPADTAAPTTVVASNYPPISQPQSASAAKLTDQPDASIQPVSHEASVGPVQTALNTPANAPINASSDGPVTTYPCDDDYVFGRVNSQNSILTQEAFCEDQARGNTHGIPLLWCGGPKWGPHNDLCEFKFPLNVLQLADPADASKMQPGKIVQLTGAFHLIKNGGKSYMTVTNAKVTWVDPWGR